VNWIGTILIVHKIIPRLNVYYIS